MHLPGERYLNGIGSLCSTESFDNMEPVGVDNRWLAFGPFHEYLLNAFPSV